MISHIPEHPDFILLAEAEGDDPIEVPVESDGTILLTTLTSQFPDAIGLKYRNPATGAFRAVKMLDSVFHPNAETGWQTGITYLVNKAKKDESSRKRSISPQVKREPVEEESSAGSKPLKKISKVVATDLIVLNLPYTYTESDIKKYFEEFGELGYVQLKKAPDGRSKGFAFIRFVNYEDQKKVLGQNFIIESRRVEVRRPQSKEGDRSGSARLFVGKLDDIITKSDLVDYFEQYGDLVQIHYEHGKKRYAFVEFEDPDVARAVLKEKVHFIKNVQVVINLADPVDKKKRLQQNGVGDGTMAGPSPSPAGFSGSSAGTTGSSFDQLRRNNDSRDYDSGVYAAPRYDERAGYVGARIYGDEPRTQDIVSSLSKAITNAVSQQITSQFAAHPPAGYDTSQAHYYPYASTSAPSAPNGGLPPRDDYYYTTSVSRPASHVGSQSTDR